MRQQLTQREEWLVQQMGQLVAVVVAAVMLMVVVQGLAAFPGKLAALTHAGREVAKGLPSHPAAAAVACAGSRTSPPAEPAAACWSALGLLVG
jgi:hypothetical protein